METVCRWFRAVVRWAPLLFFVSIGGRVLGAVFEDVWLGTIKDALRRIGIPMLGSLVNWAAEHPNSVMIGSPIVAIAGMLAYAIHAERRQKVASTRGLSPLACQLLDAAPWSGELYVETKSMYGPRVVMTFDPDPRFFGDMKNPRLRQEYLRALDELLESALVHDEKKEGRRYTLTLEGFERARQMAQAELKRLDLSIDEDIEARIHSALGGSGLPLPSDVASRLPALMVEPLPEGEWRLSRAGYRYLRARAFCRMSRGSRD